MMDKIGDHLFVFLAMNRGQGAGDILCESIQILIYPSLHGVILGLNRFLHLIAKNDLISQNDDLGGQIEQRF